MPIGRSPDSGGYGAPSELERTVERADALVRSAIGSLPCDPEEHHAICVWASEALGRLRPHLEGALVALARIEEVRELTDKEISYRRAFQILYQTER